MKAWDDTPLRPIPPRAEPPVSPGPALVRLDLIVVVPDAAVAGSANFAFAVLRDPETGDWFGEDPDNPGSAMIPIDRDHALPMTPEAVHALDQVADVGRSTLDRLLAGADATFEGWFREEARRLASTLGRPMPEEVAIDLLRARRGSVPPPARWWQTEQGVRLQTVRDDDDPLGWIEDWPSTEQFLVPDGEPSRTAATRLADAVRSRGSSPASGVTAEARRAAVERLAELAPDLLAYVSERNTERPG
jgi:hypothetical protein